MVKLHESLTNKKQELELPKIIKWYTCGPTIYADSHLGHARTFITFDILRRYLESKGHIVLYCMNITDIDDKILNKVKIIHWDNLLETKKLTPTSTDIDKIEELLLNNYSAEDLHPSKELYYEFVNNEEKKFWVDMDSINVKMPFSKVRVTEVINEIIEYIQELIKKDYAYVSKNGSVYFDTQRFNKLYPNIGLHKEIDEQLNLKNSFTNEKKHPNDFSLWKTAKQYEISFDSPFGKGRPSWNIECSVMIKKIFGETIDIHSGGIDLKFPHHHNECVQTTAYTENPNWVKYFLHSGHLHINKEKMAKSLNNFITIKNFLGNHNYRVLRLILMNSNWNEVLDFNEHIINEATELDNRIHNIYGEILNSTKNIKIKSNIDHDDLIFSEYLNNIDKILEQYWEEFNTIKIIHQIRALIDEIFKYILIDYNPINIYNAKKILDKQFELIGIEYYTNIDGNIMNKYIDTIVEIRDEIKENIKFIPKENKELKNKLFKISDWIRDIKMKELGIQLEDSNKNTKWKKIN